MVRTDDSHRQPSNSCDCAVLLRSATLASVKNRWRAGIAPRFTQKRMYDCENFSRPADDLAGHLLCKLFSLSPVVQRCFSPICSKSYQHIRRPAQGAVFLLSILDVRSWRCVFLDGCVGNRMRGRSNSINQNACSWKNAKTARMTTGV